VGGTADLVSVLDLGHQAMTGIFPKTPSESLTVGPLELAWSPHSGLLQLAHNYDLGEMYGDNYGYRSGLNQSMVDHLATKVHELERFVALKPGEAVLDIGSNDCSLLKSYKTSPLSRVGIDPTGAKFREFYPADVKLVPDFFSAKNYLSTGAPPPKIITSIAMFYDLPDPIGFAREIESTLAPGGIWHFEQSYMPAMLRLNSYDTACHEHIEYYSLSAVQKILDAAGMRVIDVRMNAINGASFAVTAVRKSDPRRGGEAVVSWVLEQEEALGLSTPTPYLEFAERVARHRTALRSLLESLKADGKTVLGYGASTKGNVVLQYCGIGPDLMGAIAEVNEEKWGRFTPGSLIPIISEAEARAMRPDYFLVLPWHFRDNIMRREAAFLANGGRMIFPFPEIEIL